jgi:hypothetical protein
MVKWKVYERRQSRIILKCYPGETVKNYEEP